MKKNLLIWGSALVLLVTAFYVTNGYSKNKTSTTGPNQSAAVQDSKQAQSDLNTESNDTAGEKAIDFTLVDLNGKKVSLSDFKGKNVYLNFFATWCPPCKQEMPDIEKVYQEYKDKDLVVLAVDLGEDRDTVKNFIDKNKYSFKVLLDSDQSVGEKYNISAIPVSYFIDRNGNVKAKRIGAMTKDEMKSYIGQLYK